ncbi:16S rRNA (guanine(966)-N(2))-methyltransferase RsmD [Mycoplasmopsis gallinacea]|uniref:16S rRNA (Guanine(966)-N(2))-methyltransferase RsmD n=1 Tax=Mycoplasmopsis gallinacea TaxID=29556 RepID=A0A6H0V374_9BACT|nr:16S rRNA (guanine(966)-N(2))-methyltransferase RsmD [Mycoplasmopsis gallinacea]QIW62184.1 16S rRNA (guanine(966)-N(2))-methyltransferase RsmD [Mycoplasmopsis gallinacea]
MLRIISGKYRNRKIEQPALEISRPTMDKVKESIFSSIQFKIVDKTFLDLFSGSGSMAIEAISRGASNVTLLELNNVAFNIIKKNISSLQIDNINAIKKDSLLFLQNTSETFDFIFIDAPYADYALLNDSLKLIAQRNILNEDGEIIVETNKVSEVIIPKGLRVFKSKRYGKVDILYITHE